MPAKIYTAKNIKKAFDATSRAVEDLALYAFGSLVNVTPDGVYPRRVLANANRTVNEGIFSVTVAYSLENIPAHGTWYFKFVFTKNCCKGSVTITRTTSNDIYTKSCDLSVDAIKAAVIELGK